MKPTIVISSPLDTYSGYGARSRDFIKAIIDLDKYDVKLLSQRWGNTRFGYLDDHNLDNITSLIIPKLSNKPDIWIQITVPNEFSPVGNYNIGVTAGIETNICDQSWIQGVNRMDLTLTSSKHSKEVFEKTRWEVKDNKTGKVQLLVVNKPVEVLFEGVDLTKYFETKSTLDLSEVKESFCYLVVGHWLQGSIGNDRKNIGYTIKSFLETFKNKPTPPALILKTSHVTTSLTDKDILLNKIDSIKKSVKGKLPNIYIVHGDLTDQEVNELYNHSKVKVMVTHTRGEGFGRPLLEFSMTGKPIIATAWSGHLDFLNPNYCTLINGSLEQLDNSSVQKNVLLKESSWFKPDDGLVGKAYKNTFKKYKQYLAPSKQLRHENKTKFSYESMVTLLGEILTKYIPELKLEPKFTSLKMPKLKTSAPSIKLPKLKKV
jgi:glycosyltransferase involved in cell wall biosynthesis